MSIQQEHLKAIADAIRGKEGSDEAIPAAEFAARIQSLPAASGPVGYGQDDINIKASIYKNGVLDFTAAKQYAAIILIPSSQYLPSFTALLQEDGTYLAGYMVSSGPHELEPDILSVSNTDGKYRYVWPVDMDNMGLNYINSALTCIYAE